MKMPIDHFTPTQQVIIAGIAAVMLGIVTGLCFWLRSTRGLRWEATQIPVSSTSMAVGILSGWLAFYTMFGFLPLWFLLLVAASIPAGVMCYWRDKRAAQGRQDVKK